MAKAIGCDLELDVGGQDWQHFHDAIAIRNRLTHPKALSELEVTDKEIETLCLVIVWFDKQISELSQACSTIVQKRAVQTREDSVRETTAIVNRATSVFTQLDALNKAIQQLQGELENDDLIATLVELKQQLLDSLKQE